ncbi:uncharacterized protein LOC127447999 [Myxocyprinus asiaticus]|uniref:uncharacterized protein LOC127447999 n=1 Tax=Myxocyprinus asiaticus TaxID=70543 RepID=UPI0022223AD1|nr:uncharacterized protein LOC127447999 [Myxocyprinus asiaticus]
MEPWLYAVICTPVCITAIICNILFFFCLMRPVTGVTLRYPLRLLFIVLLCNSTFQQLVIAVTIVIAYVPPPFWLQTITRALIYATFCGNFSCNAWISIFYYMSIVPQHLPILVCIKKNIRVVLYAGFTLNQVILLFSVSMGAITFLLTETPMINSTINKLNTTTAATVKEKEHFLFLVSNALYLLYCTCPMVTLSISWGKTFVYLRGHMKAMGQSCESFSQPQRKSQIRVTVTGMVQAALFLPSTIWTVAVALLYISNLFETVDPSRYITMAFSSVSGLGNVLCFGFSQSVFRKGIASLFKKSKADS